MRMDRDSKRATVADEQNLIHFLAYNAAFGALVGCAAAAGMLAFDAGGLRTLLIEAQSILAGGAMLFVGFALTFGSLAMGSAVMLLPRK